MWSRSPRRRSSRIAAASLWGILVLPLIWVDSPPAAAVTPPSFPSSSLRLEGGLVPGHVIESIWPVDDAVATIAIPFPINFFDQRSAALCVTTNGGVYPVAGAGTSCSNQYDQGVGDLAIASRAAMIAVLALDSNPNRNLVLSDGRDAAALIGGITSIARDGTIATVTTSDVHQLQTGDRVVLLGTGDVDRAIERTSGGTARHHTITKLDDTTFTIPDTGTTALTGGRYAFSDGRGAVRAVHWAETTVEGSEAIIVTWYRVPAFENNNDPALANTFQMVLRKGSTGDATDGFDVVIEFNYGSLLDDEDGYRASEPADSCSAYSSGVPTDEIDDCRWGVGWANFIQGALAAGTPVTVAGGVATITTATPHGVPLGVTRSGIRLELVDNVDPSSGGSRLQLNGSSRRVFARATGLTTLEFDTNKSESDLSTALGFRIADVYELFADTPMPELVDGGSQALVAGRLNSSVGGRYVFSMVGGVTVGFDVPRLSGLDAPIQPDILVSTTWVPLPGGALPALAPTVGEWQREDGSVEPLGQSAPAPRTLRYSAEGIEITFFGSAGSGPTNGLIVDPNGEIVCEVCLSLAAGQVIEAWMFSEPRLVAAHRVEDLPCQRFAVPVASPLDGGGPVDVGVHTLQLVLPTESGVQAVNVGVTVGAAVPARIPAGDGEVPLGAVPFLLLGALSALLIGRRLSTSG